jgi:hypothetical protein
VLFRSLHLPDLATRPSHAPFKMATTARSYCKALDCVILPTCRANVSANAKLHVITSSAASCKSHLLSAILQTDCIISSLECHTKRVCLTSSLYSSYQSLCNPLYTAIPNSTGAQRLYLLSPLKKNIYIYSQLYVWLRSKILAPLHTSCGIYAGYPAKLHGGTVALCTG